MTAVNVGTIWVIHYSDPTSIQDVLGLVKAPPGVDDKMLDKLEKAYRRDANWEPVDDHGPPDFAAWLIKTQGFEPVEWERYGYGDW